jgi:hypothetical protein
MTIAQADQLPSELRRKFAAIRWWQNMTRWVTFLAVLVVVGMFALFAFSTQDGVQGNFKDSKRLSEAMQKRLPDLTVPVKDTLQTVYLEAAPVYQKLAAERYQRVRDNLGAKALIRLQKLPEDGGMLMAERLNGAFQRVLKRVEPDLKATFPSLTDDQRRDLLIVHFNDVIEQKNKSLAAHVDKIRVDEMGKMTAILNKFQLPPDEAAPPDDQLRKELIRTMILLAEQELNELDSPQNAKVSASASAQPAAATEGAPSTRPALQ